ncbi:MAG: hypothetical protein LWW94_01000 [Candidatus Desulfofervidaceae bacterium]|nr:hypothetical protein [Candidatus Desulfofervidaceae bacterium]
MRKRVLIAGIICCLLFISVKLQAQSQSVPRWRGCWWQITTQNASLSTISGTVVGYALPGLIVKADNGKQIVVYGIGPWWFWRSQGIPRPRRGENVTIEAYEITLKNGNTCFVAARIITDKATIQLRDNETGLPLWCGPMKWAK